MVVLSAGKRADLLVAKKAATTADLLVGAMAALMAEMKAVLKVVKMVGK